MAQDLCGNCGDVASGHTFFVFTIYRGGILEYDLDVCSRCRDIFMVMLDSSGKARTLHEPQAAAKIRQYQLE